MSQTNWPCIGFLFMYGWILSEMNGNVSILSLFLKSLSVSFDIRSSKTILDIHGTYLAFLDAFFV